MCPLTFAFYSYISDLILRSFVESAKKKKKAKKWNIVYFDVTTACDTAAECFKRVYIECFLEVNTM